MSDSIDKVVAWVRWPLAFASFLLFPGLVYAFAKLLASLASTPTPLYPFLGGLVATLVAWLALVRGTKRIEWVLNFEHELTHTLFAWLTGHSVVSPWRSLRSGARIRYRGRGNWLIAIAPHVLPLFAALLLGVSRVVFDSPPDWVLVLLGVLVGQYLVVTWSRELRHHADLREAGRWFSLVFVPVAGGVSLGIVLSYAGGKGSLTAFLDHVIAPTRAFAEALLKLA